MITFSNRISTSPISYAGKFGWNSSFDYVSLGSTGFAQVGQPDYLLKVEFELPIILKLFKEQFGLKESFDINIKIELMPNEHDFGCYHEFIAIYNRKELDKLEESESDKDLQLFEDLWELLNELEGFDWEKAEELVNEAWADKHVKFVQLKQA